jgi:hypothetical protein
MRFGPYLKNGYRFSFRDFSPLLLSAARLSERVMPLHYHRHCTHMSFTAVLSMDVIQHCLSRQRSWVSNISVKVLYALRVSAGKTDKVVPLLSLPMRYIIESVQVVSRRQCDQHHALVTDVLVIMRGDGSDELPHRVALAVPVQRIIATPQFSKTTSACSASVAQYRDVSAAKGRPPTSD